MRGGLPDAVEVDRRVDRLLVLVPGPGASATWVAARKTTEARGTHPELPRLRCGTSAWCAVLPRSHTTNRHGCRLPWLGAHWAACSSVAMSAAGSRCSASKTLGLQRERSGSARASAPGIGAWDMRPVSRGGAKCRSWRREVSPLAARSVLLATRPDTSRDQARHFARPASTLRASAGGEDRLERLARWLQEAGADRRAVAALEWQLHLSAMRGLSSNAQRAAEIGSARIYVNGRRILPTWPGHSRKLAPQREPAEPASNAASRSLHNDRPCSSARRAAGSRPIVTLTTDVLAGTM